MLSNIKYQDTNVGLTCRPHLENLLGQRTAQKSLLNAIIIASVRAKVDSAELVKMSVKRPL